MKGKLYRYAGMTFGLTASTKGMACKECVFSIGKEKNACGRPSSLPDCRTEVKQNDKMIWKVKRYVRV